MSNIFVLGGAIATCYAFMWVVFFPGNILDEIKSTLTMFINGKGQ